MAESIKNFLVVVNICGKARPDGGRPRIRSVPYILKAPAMPDMKTLKSLFNDAAADAVLHAPNELRKLKSDPDYSITWKDLPNLPSKSLRRHDLSRYDSKVIMSFKDIMFLNAGEDDAFDLTAVTKAPDHEHKTA